MPEALTSIDALIARGESLDLEFKTEVNDGELVETVVCLANGGGGTLLIGVEDDGRVTGARPRHGSSIDPRRVEAVVSNSTRPAVGVRAEVVERRASPCLWCGCRLRRPRPGLRTVDISAEGLAATVARLACLSSCSRRPDMDSLTTLLQPS